MAPDTAAPWVSVLNALFLLGGFGFGVYASISGFWHSHWCWALLAANAMGIVEARVKVELRGGKWRREDRVDLW